MKHALILFNSQNKTSEFVKQLPFIIHQLCFLDYQVEAFATTHSLAAFEKINRDSSKYDLVIVSGGDGTMNQVVNGLRDNQDKPIIAYVPSGTVNDLASTLRLSRLPKQMIKLLTHNQKLSIDTGKINDELFNYVASFGMFTAASYTSDAKVKSAIGSLAYVIDGVKTITKELKGNHVKVTIEDSGEVIEGRFIMGLFVNSMSVGGIRKAFKHNVMDDGLFGMLLVPAVNAVDQIAPVPKILFEGIDESINQTKYIYRTFSKALIETSDEVVWNIDGEKGPSGTVTIEVLPKFIDIYTPLAVKKEEAS